MQATLAGGRELAARRVDGASPLALAFMLIGVTTPPVNGAPGPDCERAKAAPARVVGWPDGEPELHLSWIDVSTMPAGPG